jgi:hypothetical protein
MTFKMNHVLRQIPPSHLEEVVERFSKAQRECLCEILRVPSISEDAWRVVRMNNGGGLQFIEDMPQPAFVASMIAGLQHAAERVVGVDDMITEALDILDDMTLPQLYLFERDVRQTWLDGTVLVQLKQKNSRSYYLQEFHSG